VYKVQYIQAPAADTRVPKEKSKPLLFYSDRPVSEKCRSEACTYLVICDVDLLDHGGGLASSGMVCAEGPTCGYVTLLEGGQKRRWVERRWKL
jgi:hypothetical protein